MHWAEHPIAIAPDHSFGGPSAPLSHVSNPRADLPHPSAMTLRHPARLKVGRRRSDGSIIDTGSIFQHPNGTVLALPAPRTSRRRRRTLPPPSTRCPPENF